MIFFTSSKDYYQRVSIKDVPKDSWEELHKIIFETNKLVTNLNLNDCKSWFGWHRFLYFVKDD